MGYSSRNGIPRTAPAPVHYLFRSAFLYANIPSRDSHLACYPLPRLVDRHSANGAESARRRASRVTSDSTNAEAGDMPDMRNVSARSRDPCVRNAHEKGQGTAHLDTVGNR